MTNCGMCGSPGPCVPRIFVVDDDAAMRHSTAFLLGSLGKPVEVFDSAEDFLARWQPGGPGCLVLDVRMPGMSGLDLQKVLNERAPSLAVVFVSGHGDIPMVVRAMRAGAVHFLEKPFNDQILLDLVGEALCKSASACSRSSHEDQLQRRAAALTQRERAVMVLVSEGKTNKEIARDLDISIKTVEVHRARVMEKMGAGSVVELSRMAALLG